MKRIFIFGFLFCLTFFAFTQNQKVFNVADNPNKFELVTSDINSTELSFSLSKFSKDMVATSRGNAAVYNAPKGVSVMEKGAPDVLKFVSSVIIPDKAKMEVVVTNSTYTEYANVLMAPSKGNLYRNVDPSAVPYEFGEAYNQNKFYPGKLADMGSPYIVRDYRGQAVNFYPFQYNPVTKVLRVYSNIDVNVQAVSMNGGENPLLRIKPLTKVDAEYNDIYMRHFINYGQSKYTPLQEQGRMLIICHPNYMSDMQPFVSWKKLTGIPTEIVDVSTIGTTANAIKTYVQSYYTQKGLTFLLLVGDAAQVPTNSTSSGHSDNAYGYLSGSDSYPEVFVGRFSAENTTHVQTMVARTLKYEQNPLATPAWHNKGIGIASNEGAGIGHNGGESDIQHMDLIRGKLLGFNYTTVSQLYHTSSAPTAAQVSTAINNGASVINYIGHGSETTWVTSGFSNTNINNLSNNELWPFIWSVACVNGAFVNTTCFGEAWLRAGTPAQPKGAVAALMSTINQSWAPPMTGQDEMNDILVETYPTNKKRTFGGLSMNGCMKMNDVHGSGGAEMTDTWTCFGDPSLMVRTNTPLAMTVTHVPSVMMQETQLQVNCNVNGAFVSLTINNEILATGTVAGGSVVVSPFQLTTTDSITVVVTAYNRIPYIGKVAVVDFLYNIDAGILEIVQPESNYNCTGINIQPKVVLRNMGQNNLTSVVINYKLNNGSVQQQNWSGNLASLAKDTITLPSLPLTQGNHTYQVYTTQPNGSSDQNASNDSKTKSFSVQNLPLTAAFTADITDFCLAPASVNFTSSSQNVLTYLWNFGDGQTSTDENPTHTYAALGTYNVTLTTSAGICGQETMNQANYINVGLAAPQVTPGYNCGPGIVTLQASGIGTINWYSDQSGSTMVETGNTFVTPHISNSATFYVQTVAENQVKHTGKPDNTGDGGFFGNVSNQHYLIFDSYVPFKLLSVKVYAGSTGNRTILLRDANASIIQQVTVNVPTGESRVTLNFDVPVGANLQLVGGGNPNLFRNNNNAATFPYTLAGVLSITETSASLPQYNTPGNYYYFYDWEVKEYDCESPLIPVTASIYSTPVANFTHSANGMVINFFQSASNATSYLWNFGDGSISTQANPIHNYTSIGTFTVKLIVENPCGIDSIIKTITTTAAAPMADFSADNLTVYAGGYVNFFDMSANAPSSWYWMFEAGTPSSSNLQNPTIQYNTVGVYYVTLVASNPYGSNPMNKPAYITVLPNTGIDNNDFSALKLTVFPNPAQSKAVISFYSESKTAGIKIFNSIGELVKSLNINNLYNGLNTVEVDLLNLSSGIYYINLITDKNAQTVKLFIL